MNDLSCLNTIITDNLAVHIDLTNLNSWNLNSGFTSVSLTKWNKAISDNIFLYDFGLTGFDNGRVNKMYNTLTIQPTDTKLTLYRVGYNTATGGTFYNGYGITGVTGTSATTGNYFYVDGGYLQGFFKLKKYNYELLPPRYGSGITVETILQLTPQSFNNGYFLFMGARAEDKYIPSFSGESIEFTATTSATTISSFALSSNRITRSLQFSGVTTSENHYLNQYIDQNVMLGGSNTPDLFVTRPVANYDLGRSGNTIGFFLSSDRRIGYTRINASGITESNVSDHQIPGTGWTIIDIVFKPYEIITDRVKLDCASSRTGDFIVYVNGRRFWKITDFNEYYFKGFKTQREKQLGVPYNISWGGGTFGLKHSFHYDIHQYNLLNKVSSTAIATGFTFTTDPFWSDPVCPAPPLDQNISATTITGDSTTFHLVDPCGTGTTATTVLKVFNKSHVVIIGSSTGITATTLNQYNLLYNPTLQLLSNRDYIFTVKVFEQDIFQPYHSGIIGLFFSGETDITIVESKPFNVLEVQNGFTWNTIQYKIRTKDSSGLTKVKVGIYILSDTTLAPDFVVYFDDFNYRGADVLNMDHRKDNELIQQLYDKSFVGGIQKLRIYDVAFNSQEVLHNATIEARNLNYGFLISEGGRIIYK